jgi:uncharacterized protein
MTTATTQIIMDKESQLKEVITAYGTIAVAYSGGVDSTYLAHIAHEALGEKARMILADSPSIPRAEVKEACAIAEERGWNLSILNTDEFEKDDFLKNDTMRCYVCKGTLFQHMSRFAEENGVTTMAYGEIADDALDQTRMGVKAAKEFRVVAPLAEVGLLKVEIRERSKALGLPTWNKASFACLASRFPTGMRIEKKEMSKVEEAEEYLKTLGFSQYRARHHGEMCRIEVDEADIPMLLDETLRRGLVDALKKIGYRHVTLDLSGYRTGSTAG